MSDRSAPPQPSSGSVPGDLDRSSASRPADLAFDLNSVRNALRGRGDAAELAIDLDRDDLDELQAVARGLAGHELEAVVRFARLAHTGRDTPGDRQRFVVSCASLERLAEVARDEGQRRILARLREAVGALAGSDPERRPAVVAAVLAGVDALVRSLSEGQGPAADDGQGEPEEWRREREARRVREGGRADGPAVECAGRRDPRPTERELEGRVRPAPEPRPVELGTLALGPGQLERLYGCGLCTVEAVAQADPAEVAAVSGLSRAASEALVAEARCRSQAGAALVIAGCPTPDAIDPRAGLETTEDP